MRNSEWSLPAYDEPIAEDLFCKMEEGRCLPIEKRLFEEFDKIPGRTWQEKLDYCSVCKCCPRHQKDKPRVFVPWVETRFNGSFRDENACLCECRHNARWLCRQAPKLPQVEDKM